GVGYLLMITVLPGFHPPSTPDGLRTGTAGGSIGHSGVGRGFPTNPGDGCPTTTAGGTSATSDGAGYPDRHSAFISGRRVWCAFIMVQAGFLGSLWGRATTTMSITTFTIRPIRTT